MRIRSTKPEFWRSKLIASVSWEARLVLKALESYVDDNGVGEDDVSTLVGDCFLHDLIREPSRTLARVSEAIGSLHQAGLVWRYEANGRNLIYVSFWESVQRIDKPLKGRNPRPDGTLNYKDSEILGSVATPREASRTFAPGTGEQRNRGTEEQGNKTFSSDSADAEPDPETIRILDAIDSHCEAHGFKKPNRTKNNLTAARLLHTRDGYTLDQILWIINWLTRDSFWAANIRSASKLREKFDQLVAKATTQRTPAVKQSNAAAGLAEVATWETPEHLLLEN